MPGNKQDERRHNLSVTNRNIVRGTATEKINARQKSCFLVQCISLCLTSEDELDKMKIRRVTGGLTFKNAFCSSCLSLIPLRFINFFISSQYFI